MITFRQSFDAGEISAYLTAPDVWDWISDDDCELSAYRPTICDMVTYLIPQVDGKDVGCLVLVHVNNATVELHSALLPEYRGKHTAEVFRALIRRLVGSQYIRLRTWVAGNNRAAYVAAKRVGFELVGTEPKSFRKNGAVFDNHLFGVEICQPQ